MAGETGESMLDLKGVYVGASSSSACKTIGVTDTGNGLIALIDIASNAAIAALSIKQALEAARAQKALADKYLRMANEARNHYNGYYKPLEESSVEWACSQKMYDRKHDMTQIGRAMLTTKAQYKNKAENLTNCMSRYCSGLRASTIRDVLLEEAQATASAAMAGLRYEKNYQRAQDAARFDRRNQMLKIGRDMSAEGTTLAKFASGLSGEVAGQGFATASGALKRLGYIYNRDESPAPTRRIYGVNDQQVVIEDPKFVFKEDKPPKPKVNAVSG